VKRHKHGFIDRVAREYRQEKRSEARHGIIPPWRFVDIPEQERKGKSAMELDELRQDKYVAEMERQAQMRSIARQKNNDRLLARLRKAQTASRAVKVDDHRATEEVADDERK
jgi:hypothetical protein